MIGGLPSCMPSALRSFPNLLIGEKMHTSQAIGFLTMINPGNQTIIWLISWKMGLRRSLLFLAVLLLENWM